MNPEDMNPQIQIETIYGAISRKPFVTFKWGNMAGQLTPNEARAHALAILEAADAAESDAFIVKFLDDHLDAPPEASLVAMSEFRQFREANRDA
jgi:hypothetical protein